MPIYEFICDDCKQEYEEQKKLEDYNSNCPLCGKKARKVMSRASVNVVNSPNKSIDSTIGEVAEKRWIQIDESKKQRLKDQFGTTNEKDIKVKDSQRITKLLDRQNKACSVIESAKKEAGITKHDELKHVIGGNNA